MTKPAHGPSAVWLLSLAAILGASGADADPEAGPERPHARKNPIDRSHDLVERELDRFIAGLDRFFGDDNYAATTNESFFRLAPGLRVREGPSFAFKPRLRANLQLPRTQHRLGLVLSGRDDDEDALDGGIDDESGFAAGLRAVVFDDEATKLRLSIGSRFRPEPDPFVRLRLQRVHTIGVLAIRPSQIAFWELDDGLGERGRLDLDVRTGPRSLARLRNEATYGQSTEGVEFRTSFSQFFALRAGSAWKIELRMDAHTRPTSEVVDYRALVRYRWSMLREWLFFEVEPGIRFRREDDFDPAPEVYFRIELVFGSVERLGPFNAGPRATLPESTTSMPSSSRASGQPPSPRP